MTGEHSRSIQVHPHPPLRTQLRTAVGRVEKAGRWVLGGTRSTHPLDHLTEQEQQIYTDRLRAAIASVSRERP